MVRWGFIAAYIAGVAVTYLYRGAHLFQEIIRVPAVLYALVYLFALAVWAGLVLADKLLGKPATAFQPAE